MRTEPKAIDGGLFPDLGNAPTRVLQEARPRSPPAVDVDAEAGGPVDEHELGARALDGEGDREAIRDSRRVGAGRDALVGPEEARQARVVQGRARWIDAEA